MIAGGKALVFLLVIIGVLFVVADQLIKLWAVSFLEPIGSITVIENFFSLTYVENTGAAWGIFSGAKWYLILMPIIIIVAVLAFLFIKKIKDPLLLWSCMLIISGGIGNLIDRIFRGFVVDYIHATFIDFPVFNLADCCITIGAGLLILYVILSEIKEQKAKKLGGDQDAVE